MQHHIEIGTSHAVRKESMKDLLTIFSNIIEVKFTAEGETEKNAEKEGI